MAQVLYHFYSPSFTPTPSSTNVAFYATNGDSNCAMSLKKYRVSISGNGGASVLLQFFATSTVATGNAGSLSGSVAQVAGRTIATTQLFAQYNFVSQRASETYSILDSFWLANNETILYDYQPGDEPDCIIGNFSYGTGFGLFVVQGTVAPMTVDMFCVKI